MRLDWLDTAKGLGIILVFYGHFLQRGVAPGLPGAEPQMQLIYAFHMPLFFLVAGCLFKPPTQLRARVAQLALRRLVPMLFFGLLLAPLWIGYALQHHQPLGVAPAAEVAWDYLAGLPTLDWVTWFLVCLFVCECLALLALPRLHALWAQLVFALLCIVAGVSFSQHSQSPDDGLWYLLGRTWFLSEAVVALGFYTVGHAGHAWAVRLADDARRTRWVLLLSLAALLLSFRLNPTEAGVVMMAARQHGNAFAFAFSALAGSLATLTLGMLLAGVPALAGLRWLGRNTLPLLGLNGVFFHFVDAKLGRLLAPELGAVGLTFEAVLVTLASMLLCVPLVSALRRYAPGLIGASRGRL